MYYRLKAIWSEIRCLPNNIARLIHWTPILWKDRDWDEDFLLIIMRHKLKGMKKLFESDKAMAVGSERRAEEMGEAIKLLDYLIDHQYEEIGMKPFHDTVKPPDDGDFLEWLNRPRTPEEQQFEADLIVKCTTETQNLLWTNRDKLFYILNKNGFMWVD